jgi:hypothetical protein
LSKKYGYYMPRVVRPGQTSFSNFSSALTSVTSSAAAVAATMASGSLGRGLPERRMDVAICSMSIKKIHADA